MKGLVAGVIVIVILALVLPGGGDDSEPEESVAPGAKAATVRVSGSFERSPRADGTPIFTAVDLGEDGSAEGTVEIANSGKGDGYFILSQADLTDLPGPGGGALSKRLGLKVRDVTSRDKPVTIYDGPLNAMGARSAGFIRPGDKRRYRFEAKVERPGDARRVAGVDPYEDSAATVRYVWSAVDAAPPAEPEKPPTETEKPPAETEKRPTEKPPAETEKPRTETTERPAGPERPSRPAKPPAEPEKPAKPPAETEKAPARKPEKKPEKPAKPAEPPARPKPPVPTADRRPPVLDVDFPRVQRLLDRDELLATISCDERCIVRTRGSVRAGGGGAVPTPRLITALRPGQRLTIRTRIPDGVLGRLRRSLRAGRPATIRLTIQANDLFGNRAAVKRRVRLNPKVR